MSKASGPYATEPYRQPAGGQVYFKVLPGIPGLASAWLEGLRLLRDLGTLNHPAAPAKRALLARHLAEMEIKIKAGEIAVAEATDIAVRERIRATQVRPDNPRGPRMVNAIESRPIPYPNLPAFAVGQVDISVLDRATTRRGANRPYWPTQEFGYTGHVGRAVRGAFFPGGVRPDPAQFRVHPVFLATRSTRIGVMKIGRPIEERAFLRSGVMAGALLRERMWRSIQSDAIKEVGRILTLGTPRRPRP